MKTRNLIGVAGMVALLSACVPSLNPFYTDKDVVFDTRLLGEWQTKGDGNDLQTWKFEKSDNQAYKLLITEKDSKQGELEAYLFKIKSHLFLDIIPTDCKYAPNQADLVNAAMFPGHLVMRVAQVEPTLSLAFCDYEWLAKYLEANPEALAHRKQGKQVVLIAATTKLQDFITEHLAELFQKAEEYQRTPAK